MPIRVNSRPFAFRSFQGEDPTTEELRAELEKSYEYIQQSLNELEFANLGGEVTEEQAPFVTERFSSVIAAYTDADEALAGRISIVEATVNDARTGLAAAHARISIETEARASLKAAFASQTTTVFAQVGTAQASVVTESIARATADEAIATDVTTLTATVAGNTAAIITEASVRATADGFLSGKYTITVAAGNVVTGMNITSSTGSGTNISDVTFQASSFKIYNGTTGIVMFNVSGSTVSLANTLVVSTSGKVFIGTGTFGAVNTSFYVDSAGQFSLKDKLTWDGTTLAINGNLTSTSGTIAGFSLSGTGFSVGSGTSYVEIQSTGGTIQFGSGSNQISVISRSGFVGTNSGGIGTLAWFIGSSGGDNLLTIYNTSSSARLSFVASTGLLTIAGPMRVPAGDVSTPTYAFSGDTNTGFYSDEADKIKVTCGGSQVARFINSGGTRFLLLESGTILRVGNTKVAITAETLQYYVEAQDYAGTTIKLAVVA